MARIVGLIAVLLGAVCWGYACGTSLPGPRTGPHPATNTNYVEVPYPPPAARVEVIPPRPKEGTVWVDGEWAWQGKRWVWEGGGWLIPPPEGYLAPWSTYRLESGKLLFAPGSWHAMNGNPLPKPIILVPAQNGLEVEEEQPAPSPDAGAAEPALTTPPPALSAPPASSAPR